MKTNSRFIGLLALVTLLPACEIFENQTPEMLTFRMAGQAGDTVSVVYSKGFLAANDETGVTRVQLFEADTVKQTLPIDTVIDIRVQRQMFIQALTYATDTVDVDVQVDVNERGVFTGSGKLFPAVPWYFLYRFNQAPTQTIEIVI